MNRACRFTIAFTIPVVLGSSGLATDDAQESPPRAEAAAALRKAVAFFREKVAVHGGYVWRYSADLTKREGEGKVGATTVWVQPPGTPFVGGALVDIYELTGDRYYLSAARETAMALVNGQLHSGGWAHRIEFAPEDRRRFAYRVDGKASRKARNVSTLDDDKTQSSLRFLMRYDRASGFKDETVHAATLRGLQSVLDAQFPSGGWAHVYRGGSDREARPVRRAGYRDDGKYQRVKEYWDFYTLNDNLMSDLTATLLLATEVYGDDRYRQAALRGGDFLILAQMPDPQPAWAQQYDFDMHPVWARKFEPPAVTGGESQQVMHTLLDLYEVTGDRKYLEPVPRAVAYFRGSLLDDGRLARFYELRTNRPLYFTRAYELTYRDDDLPTHYGFKVGSRLDGIEKRYRALASRPWKPRAVAAASSRPSPAAVREVIDAMDARGAWVEDGRFRYWGEADPTRRIIDPRTFARNAVILARWLKKE